MTTAVRLLLIAGLQTAALGGLIGWREAVLATGTPVVLATEPIDPRSLFQGDFVVLRLAISRIDLDRFGKANAFRRGDPLHVVLEPGEPVWQLTGIDRRWPANPPAGAVIMKGRVASLTDWCGPEDQQPCPRRAWVSFGIESYFVPEGTGRVLEALRGTDDLRVKVAVSAFGTPAIAALIVKGQAISEEGVF